MSAQHSGNHRLPLAAYPASSQPTAAPQSSASPRQLDRCRSASPAYGNMRRERNTAAVRITTPGEANSAAVSGTQPSHVNNHSSSESQPQLCTRDETLPHAACHRCGTINKRKRHIKCDSCGRHWHLTCAHLKRTEADALARWWCSMCVGRDGTQISDSSRNLEADNPLTSPVTPKSDILKDGGDLARCLSRLRQTCRVIRRIPKGARIPATDVMTTLIESTVENNTETAWQKLLLFPYLATLSDV